MDFRDRIKKHLQQKYVQRADDRQKAMGLSYTEAETNDLAEEMEKLFTRLFVSELNCLMGYVQNGTSTTVKMYQDDATDTFIVKVGNTDYYHSSLGEALRLALADCERP